MPNKEENSRYPYSFLVLYAAIYMSITIYSTFTPVYLDSIGLNKSAIGMMLAVGTLISMISQPIWGIAGDRASSMNTILKVLFFGSAISMILVPLSNSYLYLVIIISAYTIFQSSIVPISDSIVLGHLENKRWKYGPVRMAGTIGYALMSVIAGVLTRQNINAIFLLYFCIGMIAFFTVFRLPIIQGRQSRSNKVSIWKIFKSRQLVILIAFNFVIQITFGFYYSFFAIHYIQLGADNGLLGVSMLISAVSEIPFLLFADVIVKKLGINITLICSAFIISIRWMLIHFVTDINMILLVNAMHGLSFVVFSYCMAIFINNNVPKELKASGQAMNTLLCIGIARMIGSSVGGIVSDITGIRQAFLFNALVGFIAVLGFGFILILVRIRGAQQYEK